MNPSFPNFEAVENNRLEHEEFSFEQMKLRTILQNPKLQWPSRELQSDTETSSRVFTE